MIKINLLPEDLKKEESSLTKMSLNFKGQGKTFLNIGIAAIVMVVAVHIALFFIGARSSEAYKALVRKNNQLLPSKQEYEVLKVEADTTNKKAMSIDSLMTNRFSWARKLNSLSDSMTQGIWLANITYEEKAGEGSVQSKVSPMRGGKKELASADASKGSARYLNISGYASSMGEQGTALVGKFIKDMKDNPNFYSDFSEINLESIKSEKFMDQEVMNFKIICRFKTQ